MSLTTLCVCARKSERNVEDLLIYLHFIEGDFMFTSTRNPWVSASRATTRDAQYNDSRDQRTASDDGKINTILFLFYDVIPMGIYKKYINRNGMW